MQDLDVIIKIQNDNVYMKYHDEWVPLDTTLMESGFSLKTIIILKLIALKAY